MSSQTDRNISRWNTNRNQCTFEMESLKKNEKFKQGHRNSRWMFMVFFTQIVQWKVKIGHDDFFMSVEIDVRSCFSLCVNRDQLTYWFISFWCFKYMCYLQKNTDTGKYLFIHSYLPETTPEHECCSILFGSARMTDCTIHQYSDLAKAYHIVSSFKALEVS